MTSWSFVKTSRPLRLLFDLHVLLVPKRRVASLTLPEWKSLCTSHVTSSTETHSLPMTPGSLCFQLHTVLPYVWGGKPHWKAYYTSLLMKERSIGVQARQQICSTLAWRSRTIVALDFSFNLQISGLSPSNVQRDETRSASAASIFDRLVTPGLACFDLDDLWRSCVWIQWMWWIWNFGIPKGLKIQKKTNIHTNNTGTKMFASQVGGLKIHEGINVGDICRYGITGKWGRTGFRAIDCCVMWR